MMAGHRLPRSALAVISAVLTINVVGCSTTIAGESEAMRACGIDPDDTGSWTGAFPTTDGGIEIGSPAWDAWADDIKGRATTAAGAAQVNPVWRPLAEALADAAASARSIHTQVITDSEDSNSSAWTLFDESLTSIDVQCGGIVARLSVP